MSGNFYFLLLSKVMTILVKRMHVFSTLKVKLRVRNNQTSNQNFPTPFFREKCQEDIGPVRTTRNFVCFAKKSVNAKPFLVPTIFCTYQNFCKRNETSKVPSTSFGGCKNFVRRENPLFLDIHPSKEDWTLFPECFAFELYYRFFSIT